MAKARASRAARAEETEESTATEDQSPFVAYRHDNGNGWHYYDKAGRMYRGFRTEESAQAAADAHVPIENDPTEDE